MDSVRDFCLKAAVTTACTVVHNVLAIWNWKPKKHVPPIKNPLLLKSAKTLAKEIREGKTLSSDVVQAYIHRILEVDPYVNATVECCFEKALEEAKRVDALIASWEYRIDELELHKPLLGVPFTVKLILTVKGLRCTAGSRLFENAKGFKDCPPVSLLKQAGAIVLATTNIPEFGLHVETNNLIHGRTSNPYDNRRTSGGSSGGEGALIGAGASVIGVGNDLAGSIRLPCHFSGIFGHKPTQGLVSNEGSYPVIKALENFLCSGPMCRYAEDLPLMMKVLTMNNNILTNFERTYNFKGIKICYLTEIDHPLVQKVDSDIIDGLERAVEHFHSTFSAEVRKVSIPDIFNAVKCQFHEIMSKVDATKDAKSIVTCERGVEVNETKDLLKLFVGKSTFSEAPLIIFNAMKSSRMKYKGRNDPHYRNVRESLEEAFDGVLQDTRTVLLMPTFPTTAPFHREIYPFVPSCVYMSVFNLLGLPSTQCPVGLDSQGMPFGIQIVAKKNQDPLTIACAMELEKVFGGWIPPDRV